MNKILILASYVFIIGAMLNLIVAMIGELLNNDNVSKYAFIGAFICLGLTFVAVLFGLIINFPTL